MTKTILLAEDSLDDEFFFRRVFHSVGVETLAYLKGEGIYQDRRHFPLPGVVFLDLSMPRLSGQEVLEWLRTRPEFKNILVVVLTKSGDSKELENVYRLGADSFLVKPFSQEDLESLMRHFPQYWIRTAPRFVETRLSSADAEGFVNAGQEMANQAKGGE